MLFSQTLSANHLDQNQTEKKFANNTKLSLGNNRSLLKQKEAAHKNTLASNKESNSKRKIKGGQQVSKKKKNFLKKF